MGLFPRRDQNTVSPSWRYRTEGVIWQVMTDGAGRLIGEERDTEQKSVHFFCLDAASGKALWERRSFDEPWWVGLQAAGRGLLFLHGFASPDMPRKKGITVVDLEPGAMRWRSNDLSFLQVAEGVLTATREGVAEVDLVHLDAMTGMPSEAWGHEGTGGRDERGGYVVMPERLEASGDEKARSVLCRHFPPESVIERIEYLRSDDVLVFSYWEGGSDPLEKTGSTVLAVADAARGTLLYRDVLLRQSPPPVSPPFFVLESLLCYVREHRTLTAVRLTVP